MPDHTFTKVHLDGSIYVQYCSTCRAGIEIRSGISREVFRLSSEGSKKLLEFLEAMADRVPHHHPSDHHDSKDPAHLLQKLLSLIQHLGENQKEVMDLFTELSSAIALSQAKLTGLSQAVDAAVTDIKETTPGQAQVVTLTQQVNALNDGIDAQAKRLTDAIAAASAAPEPPTDTPAQPEPVPVAPAQ